MAAQEAGSNLERRGGAFYTGKNRTTEKARGQRMAAVTTNVCGSCCLQILVQEVLTCELTALAGVSHTLEMRN